MTRRFSCKMCSHCCSGEPGFVFLSESDIERASDELGLCKDEFLSLYARRIDYGTYYLYSLKERDDYSCIFLSNKGCEIYQSRPVQCMTYPFWPGLCDSDQAWNEEKRNCPGLDSGKEYDEEEILHLMEESRKNVPYRLEKGDDFAF